MSASRRQQGVVLVVVLVLLTVLTLLGTTAMRTSTLEERIAGNGLARLAALQVAETGLRQGEQRVRGFLGPADPTPGSDGGSGLWALGAADPDADADPWWRERDPGWWTDVGGVVIEQQAFVKDTLTLGQPADLAGWYFYRITTRATVPAGRAAVVLRSTYARRY
ncbi:MAG: PilX N-terminal domain-containing pilus assembly protein [Gammaproteobacteria bacterium]